MVGSFKIEPLQDDKFFDSNNESVIFKKLAYSLTMFHAILLQRRNFGALGWNIKYEFTSSDLQVSLRQLHFFVDQYSNVPFNALKYLIGECNYGGRVTEKNDRRILSALLEDFMGEKVLDFGYCTVNNIVGLDNTPYVLPDGDVSYYDCIDRIQSMPEEEHP